MAAPWGSPPGHPGWDLRAAFCELDRKGFFAFRRDQAVRGTIVDLGRAVAMRRVAGGIEVR
jgi:hypothetical protein